MTTVDPRISERDFQSLVVDLAKMRGWLVYHTHDSRRSDPGFPDLVMSRGSRLILAELKSMKGRLSVDQMRWHTSLSHLDDGDRIIVRVWRPSDLDEIVRVLGAV